MRVAILGAGTFGELLAEHLRYEQYDAFLIEKDPEIARAVSERSGTLVETGDGTRRSVLLNWVIDHVDAFVAVTGSDEINMVTCGLVANAAKRPIVKIARIRRSSYISGLEDNPSFFGIDHVLNPDLEAAQTVIRSLEHGAVSEVIPFDETGFVLRDLPLSETSRFNGKMLADIRRETGLTYLIAAIHKHGREFLVPTGTTCVTAGDRLYVVCEPDTYVQLLQYEGTRPDSREQHYGQFDRVLIMGAGILGLSVARHCLTTRRSPEESVLSRLRTRFRKRLVERVTIVDRDRNRCNAARDLFPDATIINTDIRDERRLGSAIYRRHDVLVAATGNEELNMIGALYAKSRGTPRAITLLTHAGYGSIARSLGIDVPVSVRTTMANTVTRLVKRHAIRNIHAIPGSDISAVEMEVGRNAQLNDKPLSKRILPRDTLVSIVTRNGTSFIPAGDTVLSTGDRIVVVSRNDSLRQVIRKTTGLDTF